jgi:hypothetical protein
MTISKYEIHSRCGGELVALTYEGNEDLRVLAEDMHEIHARLDALARGGDEDAAILLRAELRRGACFCRNCGAQLALYDELPRDCVEVVHNGPNRWATCAPQSAFSAFAAV